jgi:acyl carrier protein
MDNEALSIRAKLMEFVTHSFNVSESEIRLDESLIDQGIIDSFGLIEITAFIEKEFGVVVLEKDMTREAFGSMNKMAIFIATRLPGKK